MSDLLARRERGDTLAQIAADLGITRQAVHARLKRLGATDPQPNWADRRESMLLDVEWLIDAGESPASLVERTGYASQASLARALRRAERPDLARYVERRPR